MVRGILSVHLISLAVYLLLIFATCFFGGASGYAASFELTEPFIGVRHFHRTANLPRMVDMHIIEIDPTAQGIDFLVTPSNGSAPGDTVAQTTRSFLATHGAQIAINASFYASAGGGNLDVLGLSASRGDAYSEFNSGFPVALNVSADNLASIIQSTIGNGTAHNPNTSLFNAVGGNERLILNGAIVATDTSIHPRSAAGVTENGKLLLVAVDGRNAGHSLGIETTELAKILKRFGAYNAINLDGGGSTTLVFADPSPRVVNIPVGSGPAGSERAVANNFGVFAAPQAEPRGNRFVFANFDEGDAGTFSSSLDASLGTHGVLSSSVVQTSAGGGMDGFGLQRVLVRDDPSVDASPENPSGWFVRHAAGRVGSLDPGTRSANEIRPATGAVGLWARTFQSGTEVSLAIDNSDDRNSARGLKKQLVADGQWHRYEWDLRDDQQWEGWAGGPGLIDFTDFTLDSVQLFGPNADATIFIDDIYHETIPVVRELVWGGDTSGDWNEQNNWRLPSFPGQVPAQQKAVFGNAIHSPQTIFTNSRNSVNALQFDSEFSYSISGTGAIELQTDTSGPVPATPTIVVDRGNHQVQLQVELLDDTVIDVASNASLAFHNQVNLAGHELLLNGAVEFHHSIVGGGTLRSAELLSPIGNASISADLVTSGVLRFDVSSTTGDQLLVNGNATLSGILDVVVRSDEIPLTPIVLVTSTESLDITGLALDRSDSNRFYFRAINNELVLYPNADYVPEAHSFVALIFFVACSPHRCREIMRAT